MSNPLIGAVEALARDSHVRSLGELLANPALTQPPPPIIPSLVYEGRVTLLSGREKSGKSTLAGQAFAALSAGSAFLDYQLGKRRTLWFALDEPLGDLVRRARDYGADHADFWISDVRPESPARLAELIHRYDANAVVVDTLSDLWSGFVKNEKEATEVGPFMRPYVQVARDTGAGLLLLHHLPKALGSYYRGSTALGASVDILARLSPPRSQGADEEEDEADDDGRRVLTVKGRGGIAGSYALSFDGVRYSRGDAPLPMRHRVLSVLSLGPMSSNALVGSMGKRKGDVLAQVRELKGSGLIEQASIKAPLIITPDGMRYLAGTDAGTDAVSTSTGALTRGTVLEPEGNPTGTSTGTDGRGGHRASVPAFDSLSHSREPMVRWAVLVRLGGDQVGEVHAVDEAGARKAAERAGFGLASHRVMRLG